MCPLASPCSLVLWLASIRFLIWPLTWSFCPLCSPSFFSCLSVLSCSKVKWWKIRNRIYLVNWVHVLVCILSLTSPTVPSAPMSLDYCQWLFHPRIVFPAFIISELFQWACPVQYCPRKLLPNTMSCFQPHSPGSRTARRVWFPFLSVSCIVHPAQCYTNIGSLSVFLPQ